MRMLYDYLVIGGGMAGVSSADALASRATVVLLELEPHLGYHSTARSAALFAPAYGSMAFRALSRASEAFLESPPADFFPASLLRPRGALLLARADQLESFEAEAQSVAHAGVELQRLSAEEARHRVPCLRAGYLAAAAYEPQVRDIDVEGLFRGFVRRAKQAGVMFHTSAQISGVARDRGVWHLTVGDQTLSARAVVNAAGAWCDQVAQRFGASPLGLRVLRRCAAIIDAPAGVAVAQWPVIFDVDDQFYLKPEAGRLLISPADEEPVAPGDAHPEDLAIAVAVDRLQRALEIEVPRVHRSWAGLRTFAPDRDPVIGYDAQVEGFFWCAGQGGYGIQSAPAFAQLAAAILADEPLPPALRGSVITAASLSPRRFSATAAGTTQAAASSL
jgi:D-arginine dehydrogenase